MDRYPVGDGNVQRPHHFGKPAAPSQEATAQPVTAMPPANQRGGKGQAQWQRWLAPAASFLKGLVLVLVLLYGASYITNANSSKEASTVNKNAYQAVFLTNGQVYFGKLKTITNSYVDISDIYYLQVQQTVQPKDSKDSSSNSTSGQPQLVKLGNELHGPEDSMKINRSQVLFWENLKGNGKVSDAIKQYVNSKK